MKEFEFTGKAMGTEYSISVVCTTQALADQMYNIAKKEIELYEARFSRFLPTSELSILNIKKDMEVSKTFIDLTSKAHKLFDETKGVFNPLVQISRLGYDRNFDDIGSEKFVDDESQYNVDFSLVDIDTENSRIHLIEGQKLDFGGFLKGYLAEKIAKNIKAYSKDIVGVIVNLGGDVRSEGVDENGNDFIFKIYNPVANNEEISVSLKNKSLATSGIYKRTWLSSGKKIHHILDISGKNNPDNEIVSASVIHKDGAKAEAYAKVFLSIGHVSALKLLGEDISFVVIKNNGEVIKNI